MMILSNFTSSFVLSQVFILPLTLSFSINGLRLTNVKTSFAAGFGLHHWSILEGELTFET